jgi:uncharacterized protein YyaL (SSP411 family)
MDRAVSIYRSTLAGGFSDRATESDVPGLLMWQARAPEEEMAQVEVLLRLHHLSGEESYRAAARTALEAWADEFGALNERGASYALAAAKHLQPPLRVIVLGGEKDPGMETLRRRAARLYHPWRVIEHPESTEGGESMKSRFGLEPSGGPEVAFCFARDCAGPFSAEENLRRRLRGFLNKGAAVPTGGGDGKESPPVDPGEGKERR